MLPQVPIVALTLATLALSMPVPEAVNEPKAVFVQPKAVFDQLPREAVPKPDAVFAEPAAVFAEAR